MSPSTPNWFAYGFGAIVGSLIVGALLGLIPFVLGQSLAQVKIGRLAFLCTVAAGFLGGAVLAFPTALVFAVVIVVKWRRAKAAVLSATKDAALLRWAAVIPAALIGWSCGGLFLNGARRIAVLLCLDKNSISGACIASWFADFESALVPAASFVAAFLFVALPTVVAPTNRRRVALITFFVAVVAAIFVSPHGVGIALLAFIVAGGAIAALAFGHWWRPNPSLNTDVPSGGLRPRTGPPVS